MSATPATCPVCGERWVTTGAQATGGDGDVPEGYGCPNDCREKLCAEEYERHVLAAMSRTRARARGDELAPPSTCRVDK